MTSHRRPVMRLPAGKRTIIAVAAVAAIGGAGALAATALAGTASPWSSAARAVSGPIGTVYTITQAQQASARAFWTPSRMVAAVTPAIPQSAPVGPAAGTGTFGPKASSHQVRRTGQQAPAGTPGSWAFSGVPTVGALFYTSGSGKHFCTASVIHSDVGSIVLTAAHCVYAGGFARNLEFVPGYASGGQPYGVWPVTQITVARAWKQHQDPNLDVAFLNVGPPPHTAGPVESDTGALNIAFALPDWQKHITVIGYNNTDQQPIQCTTNSFRFRPLQMEFLCKGFWFGTSGGPWIIGYDGSSGTGTVFGVIGGYQWGGHQSWASYSAAFERPARALLQQAVAAAQAGGS